MKKILVPCDFSDSAVQAFRFAVDIAIQCDGEVILLHVIELPVLHDTMLMPVLYFEAEFLKDLKAKAETNFNKLKMKWAKNGPKVSFLVEHGPIASTINKLAESKKADLIVMGTKGATGLREFFVGSNTEKIVRQAKMPVIAIKKYVKASSIKNIVFPNTLSTDQEDLTMKVKELQEFFNAKLHLVYINTPLNFHQDPSTLQQLRAFTKRFMIENVTFNVFNDLNQESGVINFAHQIGADMIVMATHGRKGLNHLMSGSIAENIVNQIDCPIWTYVEVEPNRGDKDKK